MMVGLRPRNAWIIWFSFALALLLSVVPVPNFMDTARPLWLAMFVTYWMLALPHRVGMITTWLLGLAADVLYGSLLGQNALVLTLVAFLVLTLQQRLRVAPLWSQSLMLLIVFGLAQLVQLWLNVLVGNRPSTLLFLLPVPISALCWPWVSVVLRRVRLSYGVT